MSLGLSTKTEPKTEKLLVGEERSGALADFAALFLLCEEFDQLPTSPIEAYGGGARDNIHLTSKADGMEWLEARGVDTTFL